MSELKELVRAAERIAYGPQGCAPDALRSLARECERIAKEVETEALAPKLLGWLGSWVVNGGGVDFRYSKEDGVFLVYLRNLSATTYAGKGPEFAGALRCALDAAGR